MLGYSAVILLGSGNSFWTQSTIRHSQLNVQLSVDVYHRGETAHPLVTPGVLQEE